MIIFKLCFLDIFVEISRKERKRERERDQEILASIPIQGK
jgi:hypothetical protein